MPNFTCDYSSVCVESASKLCIYSLLFYNKLESMKSPGKKVRSMLGGFTWAREAVIADERRATVRPACSHSHIYPMEEMFLNVSGIDCMCERGLTL